MSRPEYFREYRRRNAGKLNAQARNRYATRVSSKFWLWWLLDTLEFPPEPEYVVPIAQPARRPLLRLRKP